MKKVLNVFGIILSIFVLLLFISGEILLGGYFIVKDTVSSRNINKIISNKNLFEINGKKTFAGEVVDEYFDDSSVSPNEFYQVLEQPKVKKIISNISSSIIENKLYNTKIYCPSKKELNDVIYDNRELINRVTEDKFEELLKYVDSNHKDICDFIESEALK